MQPRIGADRRGFTLIEVLMAAFVLAIGVLGLTALFAGAARQQQLSTQTTRSVAAARSADAFIAERFGPIEKIGTGTELRLGSAIPKNNQGPDTDVIQNDQWYAVPRSSVDGSLSLNPREAATGWPTDTLYNRAMPREVLPRLLFRTRVEERDNALVRTGIPGGPKGAPAGTEDVGVLDDDGFGAPSFDGAMRELRAIADSITVRVVVREYPCATGSAAANERSLTAPVDTEIRLRWDGASVANQKEFVLVGGSPDTKAIVFSDPQSKDSELTSANGETELTYVYIDEVVKSLPNDPGCGTAVEHWVERLSTPSECDGEEATLYLWTADPTEADVELMPSGGGNPGYDIRQGTEDGKRYLYAVLRSVDRCNTGSALYRRLPLGTGGAFVIGSDNVTPPVASATSVVAEVRKAHFPTKFIHEIWLEDYRYRAHTLASLPETISYASTPGVEGARVPQIGYSMVFRRRADSSVQYALISYAIAPTNPSGADRADTSNDDFFPREDAGAIASNAAPIRLVQDLRLVFDEDLGQYYVELTGARATSLAFVATPGQVLLFNGDAANTPPIPGADGPVRVVSVRRVGGTEVRAYLDGPPRAGLRALTDFNAGDEFDAWVVQAKCELMQKVKPSSTPIYYWGLRPIEARLFTVSP